MHQTDLSSPLAGEIATAVRFLRHFPEAFEHGATLCPPTGAPVFIDAATVRATMQEASQ
jgi:hypothetical protein